MQRLALFTFLILSFFGVSQNEITLSDKAERLTNYLSDVHLRPRALDSTFGLDVNVLLLDDFDPNQLFFTSSDVEFLTGLSIVLSDEISQKTANYASAFKERYTERRNIAERTFLSLIEQPLDLKKYASRANEDTQTYASSDTDFRMRWERTLTKRIIDELLDFYDEDSPQTATDLLKKQAEATQNVKKAYLNYFERLKMADRYFELRYLNAITLAYDPHSSFFDLTLKEEYKDELVADRAIFGISYQRTLSGKMEISGVVPGSSAWFSGEVHVGDEIVAVSASNRRNAQLDSTGIDALRDFFTQLTADTITLTLRNEDDEVNNVQLVRSKVYSDGDVIKTAVLSGEKKIGYISLPDFYTNWTDNNALGCANDVAKSLLNLQKDGVEGYILDLRDNGGGSLKEAIDLVGIFINFGPVIVEEVANGDVYTYKDMNRGSITTAPLIVLVNAQSASASEVVAGALQDYNRALIVGQTTFGKATGQNIFPLDPAINPYETWAKENSDWGYAKATCIGLYRVSTRSAQGRGIVPDLALPKTEPSISEYENEQPHSIALDSVDKKIYATIGAALPVSELNKNYAPSAVIEKLATLSDSILQLEKVLATSYSLETSLQLLKTVHQLYNAHDELVKGTQAHFTPVSKQFNAAQLLVAPYLEKYNAQFHERLTHDVELDETYQIMLNYIQLTQ